MLDFEDDASRREKCYTTLGSLPYFIDPKQPPAKKAPFASIAGHPWIHTVQILLPEEAYTAIQSSLDAKIPTPQYARVFMSLSSLLEGDFFNTYIKTGNAHASVFLLIFIGDVFRPSPPARLKRTAGRSGQQALYHWPQRRISGLTVILGNVIMISEGRAGSDDVFSLHNGILRLELGKAMYERTGLTGKPIRSGGRKHAKERFVVEINLRLPSMLHGKKGFGRIEWAFKNVLNQSLSWLFVDLSSPTKSLADPNTPLAPLQPQVFECKSIHASYKDVLVPPMSELCSTESIAEERSLQEACRELAEWLGMVSLQSPQIALNNTIDPYLSRYSVPDMERASPSKIISLTWRGLLSSHWIRDTFVTLLKEHNPQSQKGAHWFALSANALGRDAVEARDGYLIAVLPSAHAADMSSTLRDEKDASKQGKQGKQFVCWEFVGASLL